jgi:hypothetical protein
MSAVLQAENIACRFLSFCTFIFCTALFPCSTRVLNEVLPLSQAEWELLVWEPDRKYPFCALSLSHEKEARKEGRKEAGAINHFSMREK